jgi:hypothetical protein
MKDHGHYDSDKIRNMSKEVRGHNLDHRAGGYGRSDVKDTGKDFHGDVGGYEREDVKDTGKEASRGYEREDTPQYIENSINDNLDGKLDEDFGGYKR